MKSDCQEDYINIFRKILESVFQRYYTVEDVAGQVIVRPAGGLTADADGCIAGR